jgi:hypothetical protein
MEGVLVCALPVIFTEPVAKSRLGSATRFAKPLGKQTDRRVEA